MSYDIRAVLQSLVEAKAAIMSLKAAPYQRDWVDRLQELQLKMEVAGTSRIEGAEFTDVELDVALDRSHRAKASLTRSQRQARAAAEAYRWISTIPDDQPVTEALVCEIHRRVVTDCDDDHCEPGKLRRADQNVTFGIPRHRGCEGGETCRQAMSALVRALNSDYQAHDPLVQALALHYHFAAMHPFLDGNGRTARALEALILQRAGLRDTAFIAMSNYYHEEKPAYLSVLADVRAAHHDLTRFIEFGLKGVAKQCDRLFQEIKRHIQKAVYRNIMYDLFQRLQSPRRRVIAQRQIEILKLLLERESRELSDIMKKTDGTYSKLQNPQRALIRDLNALIRLGAISPPKSQRGGWLISINLNWPAEITESDFMERIKELPKGKMHPFL